MPSTHDLPGHGRNTIAILVEVKVLRTEISVQQGHGICPVALQHVSQHGSVAVADFFQTIWKSPLEALFDGVPASAEFSGLGKS